MQAQQERDLSDLEFSNRCLYHAFQAVRYIPVIKRVYPSLLKQWARLTWTGGYKVKRYKGFFLLLNYRNALDRKIGLHGGHEIEQFSYFFSNMKKGCDVFLDIGANIGTYSMQAAHLGVAQEIHAFEPDPRNYAQLLGNAYLNKFTTIIHAHQYALSAEEGMLGFDLGPDNKPDLTKVTNDNTATHKFLVKPLDGIFSFKGKRIFMKIDTEGHELDVLKGAMRTLKENSCFLQIEAWPDHADILKKELEALGYACLNRIQNDYYFSKP